MITANTFEQICWAIASDFLIDGYTETNSWASLCHVFFLSLKSTIGVISFCAHCDASLRWLIMFILHICALIMLMLSCYACLSWNVISNLLSTELLLPLPIAWCCIRTVLRKWRHVPLFFKPIFFSSSVFSLSSRPAELIL